MKHNKNTLDKDWHSIRQERMVVYFEHLDNIGLMKVFVVDLLYKTNARREGLARKYWIKYHRVANFCGDLQDLNLQYQHLYLLSATICPHFTAFIQLLTTSDGRGGTIWFPWIIIYYNNNNKYSKEPPLIFFLVQG